MKSLKKMVFGIGFILLGIYCKVMCIGYLYSRFWLFYLPIGLSIIGICFLIVGFYDEKE